MYIFERLLQIFAWPWTVVDVVNRLHNFHRRVHGHCRECYKKFFDTQYKKRSVPMNFVPMLVVVVVVPATHHTMDSTAKKDWNSVDPVVEIIARPVDGVLGLVAAAMIMLRRFHSSFLVHSFLVVVAAAVRIPPTRLTSSSDTYVPNRCDTDKARELADDSKWRVGHVLGHRVGKTNVDIPVSLPLPPACCCCCCCRCY